MLHVSQPSRNESECSSLPAGFLLTDFVLYVGQGFQRFEVTSGQG